MTIFQGKRVLFVSHRANFQKFNQPLIKMLRAEGAIVDYASDGTEKIANVRKSFTIAFNRHPWAIWNHIRAFFQMRRLLQERKYDLIHTHTPTASAITRLANGRKKSDGHKPLIYTAHHFQFKADGSLVDWIWFPIEWFLGNFYTDAVVTISSGDYALAKKHFKRTLVRQISGVGVDLAKFRSHLSTAERAKVRRELGLSPDDFAIGYVAEMINRKNHKQLLQIFAAAYAKNPNLRLLLVGEGKNIGGIKRFISRFGLENGVSIITKKLPQIEYFYESLDLEISSSRKEGLGMHLLEALAVGTPILASDIDGHREFATPEQLFDLRYGAEVVEKLDFLSQVCYNRSMSGKNAVVRQSLMPEKFALDNSLEQMEKIYAKVLKNARL
ncbi:MAG: glycosyltransferase [Candidatus Nomurabacteria bacterium]|jgi:glycosyltransferase EpsD|nr:glycosyltransferase [Candidatus Nomurabacteria bacterium]